MASGGFLFSPSGSFQDRIEAHKAGRCWFWSVSSALAPLVGGGDGEAMGKRFLPRCNEEAPEAVALNDAFRVVELALDGVQLVVTRAMSVSVRSRARSAAQSP